MKKILNTLVLIILGCVPPTMLSATERAQIMQQEAPSLSFYVAQKSDKGQQMTSKTVKLSSEDRARMARLKEEVSGRLTEIGMIVSRNLGIKGEDMVPLFIPFKDKAAGIASLTRNGGLNDKMLSRGPTAAMMGYVCFFSGGELIGCGCYDDAEGTCSPC